MARRLCPHHGSIGPHGPSPRVYLSACSPCSQWACRGYFPRISGELLRQQCWEVLDYGCRSGSSIIIKMAHWIKLTSVWWRNILCPNDIKLTHIAVKETNIFNIFLLGLHKHLEPIWVKLIKSRLVARTNRNMVVNCLSIKYQYDNNVIIHSRLCFKYQYDNNVIIYSHLC